MSVARAICGKAPGARWCLAGVILAIPVRPLEPDVVVPANVVHGWAKQMFFHPESVQELGRVWNKEVPQGGRGNHASGPVAVVVATLNELGWEETGPDAWIIG
eukprot:5554794-Heterocapsa_arctica.AAC.1